MKYRYSIVTAPDTVRTAPLCLCARTPPMPSSPLQPHQPRSTSDDSSADPALPSPVSLVQLKVYSGRSASSHAMISRYRDGSMQHASSWGQLL